MREKCLIKNFFLYITPLVFWGFYNYVGFSSMITKLPCFVMTVLLIFLYHKEIFFRKYQKGSYSIFVKYYIILLFVSMMMAYLFWGQGPLLSFRATSWGFIYLYYFVLNRYKPKESEVFRLIMIFSTIYVFLWILSLLNAPFSLFDSGDELNDGRGIYRIIIKSYDIVCLGYFCCICKLRNEGVNIFWLCITVLLFVMVLLGLTRLIIVTSILIPLFYFFNKMKRISKYISIVSAIFLLLNYSSVLSFFEKYDNIGILTSMVELTDSQLMDVSEENSNWRIIEYKMGLWEYPRNIVTYVFGSGTPHPESSYGKFEESLVFNRKFNRSDAGYPALLITLGLVGLILFLSLFIKVGKQRTLTSTDPYKLYIIFIVIINLMQDAISYFGISIALSLYMLEQDRIYQIKLKQIKND